MHPRSKYFHLEALHNYLSLVKYETENLAKNQVSSTFGSDVCDVKWLGLHIYIEK